MIHINTMEILDWIQDWFKNNCDGNWEKGEVIQITNLSNPGWEVEIDVSNTSLATITIPQVLNETSKDDWFGVQIENQKFTASGDIGKLTFLLNLFKDTVEKIEGV